MSKKFYTPNTTKPQTATVGEFKAVGLESDAIIQRVSKDLYANPASGIRELLANEIRAAIKAKEGGADPRIEVTVTDGMIRVWGIDSLGMEREIFDTVYTTLGRSSNFDGKTPGQFGLGRAAYMTISDHMLLETSCRNGDKYSVLGVEGRGYQTGLPEPDIPHGTRVTMAPRDPTTDEMVSLVRDTATRSPIPIRLITEDGMEELAYEPLADSDNHIATGLADGDNCITADLPEAEIAVNPHGWRSTRAYLCGIPVKFEYRGNYSLNNLSIDIHDERKFPPTPDRERMTEKAEQELSKLIDAEISNRLAGFPTYIMDVLDHPDRSLAMAFLDTPIMDQITEYVHTSGGMHRLVDIEGRPILNCHRFDPRQTRAVRKLHPNAVFVKGVPALPYITHFMKEHGIKAERPQPKTKTPPTSAVIHRAHHSPTRIDPQNPPEGVTVYKVSSGHEIYGDHPVLSGHNAAMTIHDVKGAVSLADAKRDARARTYQTSRGEMAGQDILDADVRVFGVTRRTLAECWGDGPAELAPSIAVFVSNAREFAELRCQSSRFRVRLSVDGLGRDERVIETYIRLDNPLHREILTEHGNNHKFCDDLMLVEGKALDDYEPPAEEAPEEGPADLAHTYQTSRGEMTGREILDSCLAAYPVTRQSLADCWGDGPDSDDRSIAVVVGDDYGGFTTLSGRSHRLSGALWFRGLGGDERVVETYLRLETPAYRRILRDRPHNNAFCDQLMLAEGRDPIPHVEDCDCGECC